MPCCDPKVSAVKLHIALSNLLERHKHLIKDTNSEPTFGESESVTDAGLALFEFMPMAEWDDDARRYDAEMKE